VDIKGLEKYLRVSFANDKGLVKELITNNFDGTELREFKFQSRRLTEIVR